MKKVFLLLVIFLATVSFAYSQPTITVIWQQADVEEVHHWTLRFTDVTNGQEGYDELSIEKSSVTIDGGDCNLTLNWLDEMGITQEEFDQLILSMQGQVWEFDIILSACDDQEPSNCAGSDPFRLSVDFLPPPAPVIISVEIGL